MHATNYQAMGTVLKSLLTYQVRSGRWLQSSALRQRGRKQRVEWRVSATEFSTMRVHHLQCALRRGK